MKNWGYELKTHRMIAKMSQSELADRIGVSPHVISCWETGRRGMTLKHAEAAFRTLGSEFVLKRTEA